MQTPREAVSLKFKFIRPVENGGTWASRIYFEMKVRSELQRKRKLQNQAEMT